ncbi:hypothetical protein IVA96_16600 [Bradyrhizobium sp. 159]|nr:hypothetical protein [Bradyrhizobium sp. 159]
MGLLPNFFTAFFTAAFERPIFRGFVADFVVLSARHAGAILVAARLVCFFAFWHQ